LRILLDTSAYSAWKRGHGGVVELVRGCERLMISAVVVGELLYGFQRGSRTEKNVRELKEVLGGPRVSFLPVSYTTADRFALVADVLRRRGTPIPVNDLWIAAHALESGSDLVSFDRHFERIDGLRVVHPGE